MSAGTARDVTVFSTKDSDWIFKERTVSCPWKGECTGGGSEECDDGDASGDPTDKPCTTGSANAPCDDNCRYQWNPPQTDSGFTSTTPNGIGDACECGDVAGAPGTSGDGRLTLADFVAIRKLVAAGLTTVPAPGVASKVEKCDVSGNSRCTLQDFVFVRKQVAGLPFVTSTGCFPALPEQGFSPARTGSESVSERDPAQRWPLLLSRSRTPWVIGPARLRDCTGTSASWASGVRPVSPNEPGSRRISDSKALLRV